MIIRIKDANRRLSATSGYGLMAHHISIRLKNMGHEIRFNQEGPDGEDIVFWIRPPHYLGGADFDPNKKNVIYTMHELETFDGWKANWPQLLNKATHIIVPTEWNKQVFIKNGVTQPITVIPLGVNPKDFHGAKSYEFTIMTLHDALGKDGSRENWKDTVKAYYDAFYGNHNQEVRMTIKSYNIDYEKFINYRNSLVAGKDAALVPDIDIVETELIAEDLNKLYSKHWLFVKNANREGWCLPVWEALSAGVPIAYTDLPVFSDLEGKGFKFQVGNVDALRDIFLDQFRHWRKSRGFINQFKWDVCSKKVEEVLLYV